MTRSLIVAILAGSILVLTADAAARPEVPAAWVESLPDVGGEAVLPALSAPVTITRDDAGLPVVIAADWWDATRALGFLHARERFAQMDLARRQTSGRLSELIGVFGVTMDRAARGNRFEAAAEAILKTLPPDERRTLEVYAEGVNAGVAALPAPPPEYALLGGPPLATWTPTDSILILMAFFDGLHDSDRVERQRAILHAALPAPLYAFLSGTRSRFEAPLLPGANEDAVLAIPGPEVVDFRTRRAASALDVVPGPPVAGSNNWAIAGTRTRDGRAIVANDPHLPLMVPGVWFRCELKYTGELGPRHLTGATLPGLPGLVIGSNGFVAWGLTNTSADFQDLVVLEVDPERPDHYRTPEGWEPFTVVKETIDVRGGTPTSTTVRLTRWGPVHDEDWQGRPRARRWTAMDPGMVNFGLFALRDATDVETALDVAAAWYGPSQNVLVADTSGRIGWTISGYLPRRRGFDGSVPVSWARPDVGWDGPLDERWRPRIVDPRDGILFTANNRTVDEAWARRLGDSWALGARAQRIRARLAPLKGADEAALLDIQLDTRVAVLDSYRDRFLRAAQEAGDDEPLGRARDVVMAWGGTADPDERGFAVLLEFRREVIRRLVAELVRPAAELVPGFRVVGLDRMEEPVARILDERPAHLLPPGAADWDDFLAAAARHVAGDLATQLDATWGDQHRLRMAHPLSMMSPALRSLLDMPDAPNPGHPLAVRVASPQFGASLRMVVSPGREDEGILQLPAGPSGHPASPFYRAGHDDWLHGRSVAMRASEPTAVLVLTPR